ncbi:PREDICTED: gastric intrinsic factor-like isoform X2 [Lepidothrix coronata]|uniref:Gastric intrinsic factor-like isoform X2 n=1 Tax=Lepidothrix coronata TaxID=321398 RepID=A0A6J0J822_9PASS|nr:PREDICTED: gastric intrinsic factor-like isoform X2 [Lepidothrix coronata]
MTSGQVAEHVLALLSSCQDPRQVQALGQTIDLTSILQQKTDEEMAELEDKGHPKTTLFSVSLDTMALCLARADGYRGPAVALAKEVLSPNSPLSVDTRAVAVLALLCAHDNVEDPEVRDLLHEAVWTVTNDFLDEQEERNGLIGNIYSMGLALQALEASRDFYAPRDWDCAQAFAVVTNHTFELPMAIAQVLPALVGTSYLDAATLNCGAPTDLCPSLGTQRVPTGMMSPPGASQTPQESQDITVHYSITNNLQGIPWHYSISVTVPGDSTLLKVLERAEEMDPENFSFKTEQTSWGPFVVSIHGLAGSDNDRTYWQFLSSGKPLDQGGQSGKVGVMLGVSMSHPHTSLCHRGRNLQAKKLGAHPGHLQHLLKPPRDPASHQGAIKGHSSVSLCVPGENRAQIPFAFFPSSFH